MDQDKLDRLVSVRAEVKGRLRLLAPGWETVVGNAPGKQIDEIGERKYRIFVEMGGSLYIWQKENGQIILGGVVYYKPSWLPKGDRILVRHEEAELEWSLDWEGKVIKVVAALDRAALSFGALQLARGKVVPQRQPVGNRLVGW